MTVYTFSISRPASSTPTRASDTAPLAYESDHEAASLERLLEQFHEKPRVEAVLGRLAEMIQVAEDVSWQLLRERYLDPIDGHGPAEGAQLDGIGTILNDPRGARDDDTYRAHLKARGIVLRSMGMDRDLSAILDAIGYESIRMLETPPCSLPAFVAPCIWDNITAEYLGDARAGGIRLDLVWSRAPIEESFRFGETLSDPADSDIGPGSTTDSSVGGAISGVIWT